MVTHPRAQNTLNYRTLPPPRFFLQADALWHDSYHRARLWAGGVAELERLADAAEAWDLARLKARQRAQREAQRRQRAADAADAADAAHADSAASAEDSDAGPVALAAVEAASSNGDGDDGGPLSGCDAEARRLVAWLRRQRALYRGLRLAAPRVRLLRGLGVRLRRQRGGPRPEEVHPGLRFAEGGGGGGGGGGAATDGTQDGSGPPPTPQEQQQQQQPQRQRALRVSAATREGARVAAELSRELRAGADVWGLLPAAAAAAAAAGTGAAEPSEPREGGASAASAANAAWAAEPRVFVLALSQLQRWCERYGRGAPVPPSAWDRRELAAWLACLEGLRRRQQQQQQQGGAALLPWQEEELARLGYAARPGGGDAALESLEAAWHDAFHRLRRAKAFRGAEVVAAAKGRGVGVNPASGSGGSGSGSSTGGGVPDEELRTAVAWLEQQRAEAAAWRLPPERARLMAQLLGPRWTRTGTG